MALNCGATFVKYLLCFFNFLLFVLGGALLAVSIWVAVDNTSFFLLTRITDNIHLQTYNESTVLETGAYILIAAGGIIFLLGFLGCCGAAMESRPLLVLYGILIILVFLLQVTAGVLIAIYKREVETHLEDFLKVTLRKHYTHQSEPNSISVTWDAMMIQLQCCGVNNYTDFDLARRWQRENESNYLVPRACCMLQMEAQEVQVGVRAQGSGPLAYPLYDESCLYNPTENNSYRLIVLNWDLDFEGKRSSERLELKQAFGPRYTGSTRGGKLDIVVKPVIVVHHIRPAGEIRLCRHDGFWIQGFSPTGLRNRTSASLEKLNNMRDLLTILSIIGYRNIIENCVLE